MSEKDFHLKLPEWVMEKVGPVLREKGEAEALALCNNLLPNPYVCSYAIKNFFKFD